MRPELHALLDRFADKTILPGLTQSVSWHAHREAEKIIDPSVVSELAEFVEQEQNRDVRRAAYFILGRVGRTLSDPECAGYLIAGLKRESNKYILSSMLDVLAEVPKPLGMDLSPIFALLGDPRWLVRHAAIRALKGSASEEAERRIIEHLVNTQDPHDMTHCHAMLSDLGTARAIPAISANLKSRKRDVRQSAEYAIEKIGERDRRD